ncbi:MAG: electron transfer flavoprotein subunit beta/FixA family protein [Chloroflexota bacterium]
MDIIVCVKRVPDTSEAEVLIARDGRHIEEKGLVFDINEWDRYAVEEAVLLKEKLGGTVTAITLGPEGSEDTLRRCLATGADSAIRLADPALAGSDAVATARALCQAIKGRKFDLVLTGAQAGDDASAQVGPVLAGLLGVPHATLVNSMEITGNKAKVHRELEGGLEEVVEVQFPALFTIQTGINEPRYVSIMGIRKAAKQEIQRMGLAALGLKESEVGEAGSWVRVDKLFPPPATKQTEILSGSLEEVTTKLAGIIQDKGA